jgi:hypothetical protein
VLDGGLIFFALFELLVRRKPPKKLVDGLSVVFMWLFLSLMVFLVFRDVRRSSSIHRAERDLGRRLQLERNEIERVKNFRPAFDMK